MIERDYPAGHWMFVRANELEMWGKLVLGNEHQIFVDVYYSQPTSQGALLPRRAPNMASMRSEPPIRAAFGRAVSLIVPVDPPAHWKED